MKNLFLLLVILFSLNLQAERLSLTISSGFESAETDLVRETLQEGFDRAEIDLVYSTVPNQRSLLNSNLGVVDGEASRIWKIYEYYPNLVGVPVSVHALNLMVLSKEKILLKDISELKNYHVGVIRGMKIAEKVVQDAKPLSYTAGTNNAALIQMLTNKRLDIAITNEVGILSSLKYIENQDFYMLEKPLLSVPLYLHLHKKHAALIPRLEKAFQSMNEDGTMKKIREKFLGRMKEDIGKNLELVSFE